MEELKSKIRKALAAGVAVATIITAISKLGLPNLEKQELCDMVNTENVVDSTFNQRVDACREYMAYALKNQGRSLEDTKIDPEEIIRNADESGIPESFIMAACHLESNFCTTPRARRTNSAFSVGSYDNGKDVVTYSDPNESIQGFTSLLNRHYLVNGKTCMDLLKPGAYVNDIGKRYASDANYESKMLNIINRIKRMYPELS